MPALSLRVPRSSPSPEELVEMFADAFVAFKRQVAAEASQVDLSFSEWRCLRLCAEGGARGGALAEGIEITPAGVTDLVDRLERRGLVRRARDPEDRRAVRVELTAAGRRLFGETRRRVIQRATEVVRRLDPADYRALATGLRALNRLAPAARAAPPE